MRYLALILPLIIMMGCSSVTTPAINVYTIYPPSDLSKATIPQSSKILRLSATKAIPSLESKNLSYLRLDGESGNYLYTKWSDSPSLLIERSLNHALEEQAIFSSILSPASSASADFVLESDLHAFYHRFEAKEKSKGVIDITYRLINVKTKLPISSKRFYIAKEAPSEDAKGGIKALSDATQELSEQCSLWIKENVENE
jgi:cholesterol transport system auxiliary component